MQEQVREINLEIGRPAAAQALERMRMELRLSKKRGYTAVKLIHGFGSSGTGGKIRTAVRRELAAMQQRGEIGGRKDRMVELERWQDFKAAAHARHGTDGNPRHADRLHVAVDRAQRDLKLRRQRLRADPLFRKKAHRDADKPLCFHKKTAPSAQLLPD